MRDIILALLLFSAFPLLLYRYQVGALVISFISFMYPQSNTYGFASSFAWLDYFTALTIMSYFMWSGFKNYKHHPLISFILFFFLWATLTTYMGINPDASSGSHVKFFKIILLTLVVFAMLNTEIRLNTFLKVLVLSIGFYGIKGGLFTIASGGSTYVLGPPNSFFADNNRMGLVLVMTIPFMAYFIVHGKDIYEKYFATACTLLTAVAVLGTQSRTSFGALVAISMFFALLKRKLFKISILILPIALIALLFMPDTWTDRMASTTNAAEDDSFQQRVEMWVASVRFANDHPIFGGGFDVMSFDFIASMYMEPGQTVRAIHSSYFQMIAEHGYVGLLIYLIMLLTTMIFAWRVNVRSRILPETKKYCDLATACACSIAGYGIISITSNIAFFDTLYFVMATLAITDNIVKQKLSESTPEQLAELSGMPNNGFIKRKQW